MMIKFAKFTIAVPRGVGGVFKIVPSNNVTAPVTKTGSAIQGPNIGISNTFFHLL